MSILLLSRDEELIARCRRAGSAEHDMNVASSVADAVEKVARLPPSVVLVDSVALRIPESDVAELAAACSAGRVIVMTPAFHADEEIALLKAGAKGCCRRGIDPESLQQVLSVTSSGGVWVTRSLLPRLVMELHRYAATHKANGSRRAPDDRLSVLTPREREVVRLIVEGASNREIGLALDISERTVKGHLSNIFQKLGVPDRLKLVVHIKEAGLTPVGSDEASRHR